MWTVWEVRIARRLPFGEGISCVIGSETGTLRVYHHIY